MSVELIKDKGQVVKITARHHFNNDQQKFLENFLRVQNKKKGYVAKYDNSFSTYFYVSAFSKGIEGCVSVSETSDLCVSSFTYNQLTEDMVVARLNEFVEAYKEYKRIFDEIETVREIFIND